MAGKRVPVTEITRAEMDRILDSEGETYEPRGLFICQETVGGVLIYTAMRNIDGEGQTEDFVNRTVAVRWLHGLKTCDKWIYKPPTFSRIQNILESFENGEE